MYKRVIRNSDRLHLRCGRYYTIPSPAKIEEKTKKRKKEEHNYRCKMQVIIKLMSLIRISTTKKMSGLMPKIK